MVRAHDRSQPIRAIKRQQDRLAGTGVGRGGRIGKRLSSSARPEQPFPRLRQPPGDGILKQERRLAHIVDRAQKIRGRSEALLVHVKGATGGVGEPVHRKPPGDLGRVAAVHPQGKPVSRVFRVRFCGKAGDWETLHPVAILF